MQLPHESRIHPGFPVSYLKKKLGNRQVIQTPLSITNDHGEIRPKGKNIYLVFLLSEEVDTLLREVLIKWEVLDEDDAT